MYSCVSATNGLWAELIKIIIQKQIPDHDQIIKNVLLLCPVCVQCKVRVISIIDSYHYHYWKLKSNVLLSNIVAEKSVADTSYKSEYCKTALEKYIGIVGVTSLAWMRIPFCVVHWWLAIRAFLYGHFG